MPSFCVVLDCERKYVHSDDVSFHRFPKEEEYLEQWKIFTGRCENWQPSRWSAICSRHFKESDFRKSATRKILKRNAIPSILVCEKKNSKPKMHEKDDMEIGNELRDPILFAENQESKEYKNELKEIKITKFQDAAAKPNHADNFSVPRSTNSSVRTVSQVISIPLDVPICLKSQNFESISSHFASSCSFLHQDVFNLDGHQQYDVNTSGTSSMLNLYESSAAPCRLCGQEDHITNSFLNDFEIFGMIQKCMPTLNIRQDDYFSKEVCSNCLELLENFNGFIDQVITHQKYLMENIQGPVQLPAGNHPTVISSVKIKQEPVSNLKINIKQEIQDTHFPQNVDDSLNNQEEINQQEQLNLQDHEDAFANETEMEDQKFHFRDSNSLTTNEIVKNCDIIEIINLEDGYIDIADDEVDESEDNGEPRTSNDNYPKVIDNKEIKILKKKAENDEPFQYVIEEHNYTRNCSLEIDQALELSEYKQEITEAQVASNEKNLAENQASIKEIDSIEINCKIQKTEIINSPKKIIPKKEKNVLPKDQANTQLISSEAVQLKEQNDNKKSDVAHELNSAALNNCEKQDDAQTMFDFMMSEGEPLDSNVRFKASSKSNIVVINESILKPGDLPFELHKCLECGLQFFSSESFDEHRKLHYSDLSFKDMNTSEAICTHFCVLCESNFDSFYELLKHRSKCRVKNQIGKKSTKQNKIFQRIWSCPMCLKTFTSKLALNNHRKYICRFPQSGNLFKCKYCGDHFKKWILCRKHEKQCRAIKIRRKIVNKENKHDGDNDCNKKCGRLLKSAWNSTDEDKDMDANRNSNSLSRYNCETCNRSYTRYQNLLRHKKVHRPKDEWNYKCGSCNKHFDRMYDLKVHLKSAECPCVPSKPDTILFVCQICGKKFKTMQVLKEHGVTHSDQLPYVCQICNKSFKALRNLRQHKITHTDAKTVQCDQCDKTFKRLNGLLQHKRGFHLKIKPHVCAICKHAYALKGDMLRCKHKFLSI